MKPCLLLLIIALSTSLPAADGGRTIQAVAIEADMRIDGRLDEPCYSRARPGDAFVQFHPHNGAPGTWPTEVYVFYNSSHLQVAFRCHDPEPGKIRADITPFAGFENNDEVTVLLDPFADRRSHVAFTVNARGIRAGADTIWRAAAAVHGGGWCAELEIPFKSLRFPAGNGGEWGINFSRRVFRLNETDYWAPVKREQRAIIASTFGTLTGLRGIRGGNNLEIFPYAGFRDSRSPDVRENRLAFGLDLKYGITSNLILDLTAAPDYSDVESDPFFNQTDPYEYRLSENRPFYSESADFFSTTFSLFYSRRVTNPSLALKVTGKEKGYSLGALFARNDAADGDRFHGVLRIKKDILRLSNIGIIYSSIEGAGDWNRNVGVDFRLRIREAYTLSGFAAFSFSENSPKAQNGIFRLIFSKRSDRGFSWAGLFDRVEPNVSVPAGYVPRTDYQRIWLLPRFYLLWEGRFLERLELATVLGRYRSVRSGELTSQGCEPYIAATFRNQLGITASWLFASDRPQIVDGGENLEWNREMFPQQGPFFALSYDGHRVFQAGVEAYSYSGGVYTEDFRQVKAGRTTGAAARMNVRPTPGVQWEWRVAHTGQASHDGGVAFRGNIFSTALRWQATRTLSSSARFQYDSLQKRFGYDFLLLYEPAPVSRMVLSLKNYCEERFRLFRPQARTLAVKLSYLIRI